MQGWAGRRAGIIAAMADGGEDLARFVDAQRERCDWDGVCAELAAGAKRTHWMWFVFPQLRGLGRSPLAQHYGLSGLAEARAYAAHPLLGPRLRHAVGLLRALPPAATPGGVLGPVDALKLASCLTLFERADPGEPGYGALLERWYGGRRDARTLALLDGAGA